MLGPDGRAMPLPKDDDESSSCSSKSDTLVPSGTAAGARAFEIQEAPHKARHRVQKGKKRSGSVIDPRAVARAFESGLVPGIGLQSRESVGNHIDSFANGTMEAAQPDFVTYGPNLAQPSMPSFPLPTFRHPPQPDYGPVYQSMMGFGREQNGQVSAYPYLDHQTGSSTYPQVGALLSSHASLPNSNGYLDHRWMSQVDEFANLYPGELRNGQMVDSNAMKPQCDHHVSPESGHVCPTPLQHSHQINADHAPNDFQFRKHGLDAGHSYIRPASYPEHSMVPREPPGLVGPPGGFMERFPPSSPQETTYSDTAPETHSNIHGSSRNCDCGKDCRCFACPEHPDNATTRARTTALSRIMVADGLLDPVNIEEVSYNMGPNGPRTNGSIASTTSTLRPEMMGSPSEEDTPQTVSRWHEQTQALDADLSSDYWTYEIPVEPSGCTCGENCTCLNCLTHGDRVSGEASSESGNLASQHSDLSNGHG